MVVKYNRMFIWYNKVCLGMVELKPRMKRQQLVDIFKDQLISGELCRNGLLPTYDELEKMFDASRVTLHHALNQLKQDGYIVSVERQGIYPAASLPCRDHFALVSEDDISTNKYWSALYHETQMLNRENSGRQFKFFQSSNLEKPETRHLLDLLERRMIAGIYFMLRDTDALVMKIQHDYPEIPAIFTHKLPSGRNSFYIQLDATSCLRKVMEYARSKNIRKIAMISKGEQKLATHFPEIADAYGLKTRPEWCLAAPERYIAGVCNLVRLLMALPKKDRPECLYITDDNLITLVQTALIETGVRVPDELQLICHCNFPERSETVLPVKRVGYDTRDILNAVVEIGDEYYRGVPPPCKIINGKYESEY